MRLSSGLSHPSPSPLRPSPSAATSPPTRCMRRGWGYFFPSSSSSLAGAKLLNCQDLENSLETCSLGEDQLSSEILFWCPVVPRTCSSLSIRDAVDPEAESETRGVRRQIRESRCQVLLQSDDKDNAHGDCQGAVCLPAGTSNSVLLTMLPSIVTSMQMRRGVYICGQEFPLQFLNAHAHEFDEHVTFESKSLQRNSNKRWPVTITVRHFVADDKKRVFAYGDGGWSAFFMENQVRLGDLLVFQLIGFSRFRVYVFPVHISQRGNDGDHHERSLFSGSR